MAIFELLRRYRALQKVRVPCLESLLDFDLVTEIGYCQERGAPITPKQLSLAGIGAAATVRRRLARLIVRGVVCQARCDKDRRVVHLTLSDPVRRDFRRFVSLARTLLRETPAPGRRNHGTRRP